MFKLGVTGSIGAGKSAVSRRLAELGAQVSNSDELAKSILFSDTEIFQQLLNHFDTSILDATTGKLDAKNLAATAFRTSSAQAFLNQLIHPKVREATSQRMLLALHEGVKLFVVDAPLIFESGLDSELDGVLVVTASSEIRKQRVFERSGISAEDFIARDSLQMSEAAKVAKADYVITNQGSIEDLNRQVDAIFEKLPI